jgi:hypothetical protein
MCHGSDHTPCTCPYERLRIRACNLDLWVWCLFQTKLSIKKINFSITSL